jgi:outer membrane protein assembly factor BamB
VEGNLAYVGEGHHTSPASVLTAFSLPDGAALWERKFRSHIESSVVTDAAKQRVYLSAGETGIWALHSQSGESLWHSAIGHSDITPVLLNSIVFTAAQLKENIDGSAFFMLSAETGATLSSHPLPGNPMGSMLADEKGNLFVATAIGQVGVTRATDAGWAHSFSPQGTLLWSVKLPAMPLPEGLYVQNASVVVYTLSNGSIIALNTQDGSTAWRSSIGEALQTDATLIPSAKPRLAAVSMEGIVTILDAKTGEEKRRFAVEEGASYPLFHQDILYISTPYNIRAYSGVQE